MEPALRAILLIVAVLLLARCLFTRSKEGFYYKLPFLPLDKSSDYNKYCGKKDPKVYHLGYSIYGRPYADHYKEAEKHGSQKEHDLREPEEPYRYFNWYDYQPTNYFLNRGKYIGFPWYFH